MCLCSGKAYTNPMLSLCWVQRHHLYVAVGHVCKMGGWGVREGGDNCRGGVIKNVRV